MSKKELHKYIDPDIPSICYAIIGIVGGVANSLMIYAWVDNKIESRNRHKLPSILKDMTDILLYLETDIEILHQIASSGEILNKKFRMGTRIYISKGEFKRYKEVTNKILTRLKKLVGLTNSLESALATEKEYTRNKTELDEIIPRLEGIIRDRDITIMEALFGLKHNIELIRNVIKRIREESE